MGSWPDAVLDLGIGPADGSVPTTGGGISGPSTPWPHGSSPRGRRDLVRLQRLPRLVDAPRRARRGPRRHRPVGETGATASRLVVGSRPCHDALEDRVCRWKGTERALLFPTGYAANLGVLSALGRAGCLIVSDERNHASIIDGCRLSRSPVAIARHNDPDHVDALLSGATTTAPCVVVRSGVLDGRRRGPWWSSSVRLSALGTEHAVRARRSPRRSRTGAARGRRPRAAPGRHPLQGARRPRWRRLRIGPAGRAVGQPGPIVHLHHRPEPGRRRRRPPRRSVSSPATKASPWSDGCGRWSIGCDQGHPSPIVPLIRRRGGRHGRRPPTRFGRGTPRPSHPSADRGAGALDSGSPSRRRTPTP